MTWLNDEGLLGFLNFYISTQITYNVTSLICLFHAIFPYSRTFNDGLFLLNHF